MASERISDMPTVSDVENVDLIPIVHAGGNFAATKAALFQSPATDDLLISNVFASIFMLSGGVMQINGGAIEISCLAPNGVVIESTTSQINVQPNLCVIQTGLTGTIQISQGTVNYVVCSNGSMTFDCGNGNNILLRYHGATFVTLDSTGVNVAVAGTEVIGLATAGGSLTIAASGQVTISLSLLVSSDLECDGHFGSQGHTTTIAAGTGAGVGPTVSVVGNDLHGTISVTTGTTPAINAIIATITFAAAYANAPIVLLYPGNAATAALATRTPYTASTGAGFTLQSNTVSLVQLTVYKWFYHVLGT